MAVKVAPLWLSPYHYNTIIKIKKNLVDKKNLARWRRNPFLKSHKNLGPQTEAFAFSHAREKRPVRVLITFLSDL